MKNLTVVNKSQLGRWLGALLLSSSLGSLAVVADQSSTQARPNIIVILADDLGYSDIGVYGSEISTPNIDALANNGLQFSNFYAGPTCAPTRSMLMSGTDNHIAGLGVNSAALHRLTHLRGRPGYEGHLNDQVVSFARLLQDVGYFTSMTGKWDLGAKAGYRPADRGFDRSFSLIDGGGSHFEDASGNLSVTPKANYYEDANKVEKLPEGFFSSEFYTSRLIDYIDSNKASGKPFFSYLAFTAPHWPLHAPDDWIDKYQGRYDAGWDVMREQRLQRMKAHGLVDKQAQLPPRVHSDAAWQSLTPIARKVETRKMEIYAAMVSNMDYHIGRLVQYLKDSDQYDNTYILFLSDNGAEGNNVGSIMGGEHWVPATFDNRLENMGRMGSYLWQGAGWAQLSSTPKRIYKAFTTDGGLAVPAIIAYPGMHRANQRSSVVATVMDIAPTVLELAATSHPGKNYPLTPIR
jgi:arylsulfatase